MIELKVNGFTATLQKETFVSLVFEMVKKMSVAVNVLKFWTLYSIIFCLIFDFYTVVS